MRGDSDIYVLEHNGRFLVRPAIVCVKAGEPVIIKNTTSHGVRLAAPPGLFASDPLPPLGPGEVASFALDAEAPRSKRSYAYAVFVDSGTSWASAEGESAPSMIVDP